MGLLPVVLSHSSTPILPPLPPIRVLMDVERRRTMDAGLAGKKTLDVGEGAKGHDPLSLPKPLKTPKSRRSRLRLFLLL